jgi:AbrB family looped-hinge helix DNA binding protein
MRAIATTKMSSRGQVVIPGTLRERLRLSAGTQFVVTGDGDVVVLKKLSPPNMAEFDALVARAGKEAKAVKLEKADVASAIGKARRRR